MSVNWPLFLIPVISYFLFADLLLQFFSCCFFHYVADICVTCLCFVFWVFFKWRKLLVVFLFIISFEFVSLDAKNFRIFLKHQFLNESSVGICGSGTMNMVHNPCIPLWSWVQFTVETCLKVVARHWSSLTKVCQQHSATEVTCGSKGTNIAGSYNITHSILWPSSW